ncbi:MAG: histidinol dehydrogenase [Thermoprotei archaeon]|nr:MAG: histidinol dehydrogenase [Thermoprotei archaeon]
MRIVAYEELSSEDLARLSERGKLQLGGVMDDVAKIVRRVKEGGDEALRRLVVELDGVKAEDWSLEATREEVEEAYGEAGEAVDTLREVIKYVRRYHEATRPMSSSVEVAEGLIAGSLVKPLTRVGVYVPRGRRGYPSTAIMTVVPAKVAGVEEVVVCTPPLCNGKAPALNLVAAVESGANRVFKAGGAHAVAALAYGTESVPRVEKVVGPGGVYVTAAKLAVSLDVAIDMPAGPSEVVVVADGSAEPSLVALDLLAQTEHGPTSHAILVTCSRRLAKEVAQEVERLVKEVYAEASAERRALEETLNKGGLAIVVDNLREAVKVVNELAPEHVELMVKDPLGLVGAIRKAGAIFLGSHAPTALGDYVAGPSHVLPAGGYARSYSGLSTKDFVREVSFINCREEGLKRLGPLAVRMAELEGFKLHALSVKARLKGAAK